MKYNKIACILTALTIFFSSCYKDTGNYEYVDINEVTITGLGGTRNVLFKVDTIRINPEVEFSMEKDNSDRYVYEWRLSDVQREENNKRPLLSNNKNLVYPVTASPGTYTLYFNVYDKETELVWTRSVYFTVTTEVSRGFYFSGEDAEGYADVDMVAFRPTDTVVVKSLLKGNGMPRYRKPIRAMHTGTSSSASYTKLWVMTEEGGYYVDRSTFEVRPTNTFKNLLFSSFDLPDDIYPVEIAPRSYRAGSIITSANSRVIVANNGYLFGATSFASYGDYYGNPLSRLSTTATTAFRVAPFVMHNTSSWGAYIVYDIDNQRFVKGTGGGFAGSNLTVIGDASQFPFPWNQGQNGRTLHYAENSKNFDNVAGGNCYALMKDRESNFHIYQFNPTGTFAPAKLNYYGIKPIAAEIAQASDFTFASTRTVLFYSVGSRLYGYDYNTGMEKNYLLKDFGEEITMINCDIQLAAGNQLYVATYSAENKGTVRKYLFGDDLNNFTIEEVPAVNWTGLLKVKSMDYRNSTQ